MSDKAINASEIVQAINEINEINEQRFIIQENINDGVFLSLANNILKDIAALSLRRRSTSTEHFRTLLIAVLQPKEELEDVLRWAAMVRRELLEPETSDLYLIVSIKDLSDESCARIESSEEFCRKFVLRRTETIHDLLSRTFIEKLSGEGVNGEIKEPLAEALYTTGSTNKAFGKVMQDHWEKQLVSELTGAELVSELFGYREDD